MKLTWKQMDALITNGILAYEPYGSFYRSNDGDLESSAISAASNTPSTDEDDWGVIDLDLVSDEERVVLGEFKDYLSLRAVMGGEEVQADA
jgi:hypothetical protein